MSQAAPAFLLRLHEADVVRLCGFDAAARGLQLAARHTVAHTRRTDACLEGTVGDEPDCTVSLELAAEGASHLVRWHCSRDSGGPGAEADLARPGCAHVAAVLAAWIRAPGDFAVPAAEPADEPRDTVHTPPPRPRLAQPPLLSTSTKRAPGGLSLADELGRLPPAEAIAMARRVLGSTTDEHEARTLLAGTLRDPQQVAALLARLDPGAAALLTDIELMGGAVTTADLDGLASRSGRPPGAQRAELAVLVRHGLIFRATGAGVSTSAEHAWRQFAGWRVPPEIHTVHSARFTLPALAAVDPKGLPLLPAASLAQRPHAARIQRGSVRSLCLALALLARAPRPYSPLAAPAKNADAPSPAASSAHRRAFPLLVGELAPRVLAEFSRSAGVSPQAARLARRLLLWARDEPNAHALLDLASIPQSERLFALLAGFRLWRAAEAPVELADLNALESPVRLGFDLSHEALRPAALAAEAASARDFVLRLLEGVQPHVWYDLDEFVRLIWRIAPLFLRARQARYASPAWWLERRADGRPLRVSEKDEWLAGEGVYLKLLLTGTLAAWGAVDLALDAMGHPIAFSLTSFGRDLVSGSISSASGSKSETGGDWGTPVLLTRDESLAVQPLSAGSGLLDTLGRWARVTEIAGSRLVYTLDADLACTAFDHDVAIETLLASLHTLPHTERAVSAVQARLTGWRARYGLSRIEGGWALIEALDEAALVEALTHVPEIAQRCRRIAPALALLPQEEAPALRAALARRGYTV